jgi:hypothetical protein
VNPLGMNDRDQLRTLGAWAERLAAPDFDFGHWVPSQERAGGIWTMPYFDFSPDALDFLRTCRVLPGFDWPAWQHTEEAQRLLNDHTKIHQASAEQLYRLLTALIRGDRFGEGTLANAYESGLLTGIARRARDLAQED